MFQRSQRRTVGAVGLIAISLLGGCSFNGSYKDTHAPDAAKLRFISDTENATLTLFDADHCEGANTGMLNNPLVNTRRRADMRFPAPAAAKAFVEVRLEPNKDIFAMANTGPCTVRFNFIPQSGGEYEAVFVRKNRHCSVGLVRLGEENGKLVRSPIFLAERGLPSCEGTSALFPKAAETPPQSAERSALIEQIVDASLTADMEAGPDLPPDMRKAVTDLGMQARRESLGFELPDQYWSEYAHNAKKMADELLAVRSRALQLYKANYRRVLGGLDTEDIQALLPDNPDADRSKAATANAAMYDYYQRSKGDLTREAISAYQTRMADLDRRFDVCSRSADCWQN